MRVFAAALACVLSAVVAGVQPEPSAALPSALRAHLRDETFGLVTSIRGLPLGVRDALQTLFGTPTLDIAEPGAKVVGTQELGRAVAQRIAGA